LHRLLKFPAEMTEQVKPAWLPPRWIVGLIQALRLLLLSLQRRLFPANAVLFEQFQFLFLLPSLHVVSALDIAEKLRTGPRSVRELSMESGADPDALYRVMRALACNGIFREIGNRRFGLTPLARPLLNGPGSMRNIFLHHLSPVNWQIVGDLLKTVMTGTDGFNRGYGKNIYEYLRDHPAVFGLFDKSMSALSSMGITPVLQSYNFTGIRVLADVGGGEGWFLSHILLRYPHLTGILYDLPEALAGAEEKIISMGLQNRMKWIAGDFRASVPPGADAFLLKNVLHNWDDLTCIRILKNICEVLPLTGKVLLIEMVIPRGNHLSTAKLIDIQMLASMPGGKERTRGEFTGLLQQSGLKLHRFHRTVAPLCILEACRIS
jgi:hypothetical protein